MATVSIDDNGVHRLADDGQGLHLIFHLLSRVNITRYVLF